MSRAFGARCARSCGSLVTIGWSFWLAQIATCASTMSVVRLAASSSPTLVASGPSSGARWVLGCRISRDRRACFCGIPHCLRERSRGDGHARSELRRAREEGDHAAVVAIERDEAARVERQTDHAAVRRRFVGAAGFSTESAHARSRFVSGPPVSASAWPSIAPHPATSFSETETACWTKPETLPATSRGDELTEWPRAVRPRA